MISRLLPFLLALLLLAGCGGDKPSADEQSDNSTPTLYETGYQGEEAILTIDGDPVTITTYFYFMDMVLDSVLGDTPLDSVDWNQAYGDMTVSEYITALTLSQLKQYYAARQYAEGFGYGLTEAQQEEIDKAYADALEDIYRQYDSQTMAQAIIDLYLPEESMKFYLAYNHYLANIAAGQPAAEDSEIVRYFRDQGYLHASYIYLAYGEEDRDTRLAEAAQLLAQLDSSDDAMALFPQLMADYGEDEAMASLEDGYYFTEQDVDASFYSMVSAMEEESYSQIIEADGGCMIVARLSLEPAQLAESYALTQIQQQLYSMRTSATVVYSDLYTYASPRSYCEWVLHQTDQLLP